MSVEDSKAPVATERYRLILTRNGASEILLFSGPSNSYLPNVTVHTNQRVPEQVVDGVRQQWGLCAYCLLSLQIEVQSTPVRPQKYIIMECFGPEQSLPNNMRWVSKSTFAATSLIEGDDISSILHRVEQIRIASDDESVGPFASPGWLNNLFEWAEEQINPLGIQLTGSFRQLNASPTFSLLRLESNAQAVWFKATGTPNRNELSVSVTLSRLFPGFVPTVVGVHVPWNGWLSLDHAGATIDECFDIHVWERAAEAIAQLQISSIDHCDELLARGCKDSSLSALTLEIDTFVSRMSVLMTQQEKPFPPPLTDDELTIVGREIKFACDLVRELRFPDVLGHMDFNGGNILISAGRFCFVDWAEACIGQPFLTFEYLREYFRRRIGEDTASLSNAYRRPWEVFCSPASLRRALAVSPLLAVFAYAISSRQWASANTDLDQKSAGYLRSLARRMQREIRQTAKVGIHV